MHLFPFILADTIDKSLPAAVMKTIDLLFRVNRGEARRRSRNDIPIWLGIMLVTLIERVVAAE